MNDVTNSANRRSGSILSSLLSLVSSPAKQDAKSMSEGEIEQWLVHRIARATEMQSDVISVDMPLADLGLDSRTAVALSSELEKLLGRELPPTLIWDYPTIRQITKYLSENSTTATSP